MVTAGKSAFWRGVIGNKLKSILASVGTDLLFWTGVCAAVAILMIPQISSIFLQVEFEWETLWGAGDRAQTLQGLLQFLGFIAYLDSVARARPGFDSVRRTAVVVLAAELGIDPQDLPKPVAGGHFDDRGDHPGLAPAVGHGSRPRRACAVGVPACGDGVGVDSRRALGGSSLFVAGQTERQAVGRAALQGRCCFGLDRSPAVGRHPPGQRLVVLPVRFGISWHGGAVPAGRRLARRDQLVPRAA